ncbi:MAG: M20 family metallo-hydrolase [Acidobacteriota bacterium]
MVEKNFSDAAKKIDTYRDEIIKLQMELTAIPALSPVNGGKGEWEKARYIIAYLKKIGVDSIEECNAPDPRVPEGTRPNIIARIKGKNSSHTIWVMSHMDIVPPGELSEWKGDPYKVRVEGNKLIGRGVEDNQQGMVASLMAVKALRELGVTPEYDVGLAIVSDEETGSDYGIDYVIKNSSFFRKEDLIIVPDAGNEDGSMIEVAEKSILWTKYRTIGKQCHGSTPERGINAHKAAATLLLMIDSLYKKFPDKDPVFDPPISTFEPTKKENNVPNVNTIPGEDVFYTDFRILPKYKVDDVLAEVSKMIKEVEEGSKVKITTEYPQRADAAPPTPTDAPVVIALKKAIKDVYNVDGKPMGIGGGTVAALFRRGGFHAAVWSRLDESAHSYNEYCYIDNIAGDAKVFAHIFLQK